MKVALPRGSLIRSAFVDDAKVGLAPDRESASLLATNRSRAV